MKTLIPRMRCKLSCTYFHALEPDVDNFPASLAALQPRSRGGPVDVSDGLRPMLGAWKHDLLLAPSAAKAVPIGPTGPAPS